ncbi:MAG: Hsp20/alpha crystallin family protein [Halodesulfurarchaeum sp.]
MRCSPMALPSRPSSSWLSSTDTPSRLFGFGGDDYELYEQDGEFVLSIEMPGFEVDDIEVGWHEGQLTVGAEREDEERGKRRTYRRSFRMPKEIDEDEIRARYKNGVLDVYLPAQEDATVKGKKIPIES